MPFFSPPFVQLMNVVMHIGGIQNGRGVPKSSAIQTT